MVVADTHQWNCLAYKAQGTSLSQLLFNSQLQLHGAKLVYPVLSNIQKF